MQRTFTLSIGSLVGNVVEPLFRYLEAIGAALGTVQKLMPSLTNPQLFSNPFSIVKNALDQGAQSFRSSLEEQDQAAADTAAARERRARLRETVNLEAMASGSKSASTVAQQVAFRQPQSTDPLARIGGFTQFGAGISDTRRMMEQQTRLLQSIASATKETAVKIDN
jgi:hypothetical protein